MVQTTDITRMLVDISGYLGMALLLLAFVLLTLKKVKSEEWKYPLINLFGALFASFNAAYYGAVPVAILNVAWFFIGIVGLVNALRKKTKSPA